MELYLKQLLNFTARMEAINLKIVLYVLLNIYFLP